MLSGLCGKKGMLYANREIVFEMLKRTRKKQLGMFAAICASLPLVAGIVPVEPIEGRVVALQDEGQRKILDIDGKLERLAALEAMPDAKSVRWRKPGRVVLRWRVTEGEHGPWKIRIATDPSLENGRNLWIGRGEAHRDGDVYSYEMPRPNLDLDRKYWWKIWGGVKCDYWDCDSTIGRDSCSCGKTPTARESAVAWFSTSPLPPRWIRLEGRVGNIRDLGGWKTCDGGRVRTGMIFRGEGLNDNSFNGDEKGRSRLMVEDVEYMTQTLGIKTDLDLRSPREVSTMRGSPLGASVRFVHHSSHGYGGIFHGEGKRMMAENFRIFCDKVNYPVYFHCIAGADRTGSLAYILNGLLGVGKEDLERDWESTFYPNIPGAKNPGNWQGTHHFDKGLAAYAQEGDTLRERIERYLLDCGVTPEEIAAFRAIMKM